MLDWCADILFFERQNWKGICFFIFTATIDQMLFVFDIFGGRMLEFRIFSGLNLACYLYFVYIILDSVYGVAVKLKLKGKEHN